MGTPFAVTVVAIALAALFAHMLLQGDQDLAVEPQAERMAAECGRPSGNVSRAIPLQASSRPAPNRDTAFERAWTTQAAETVHVDAEGLNDFAELRAGDGPVRDLETRDFGREIVEELADARNYLTWRALQEMHRLEADGELTEMVAHALAAVTLAYDWAARIRQRATGA
jgi:hypothetical protein